MAAAKTEVTGRTQGEVIALTLAAVVIGGIGIYLIRDLLGPAFFALTLVITFRPIMVWASRHHIPRPISAIAVIAIIYIFILGFFAALGLAIAQLVEVLPDYSGKFQQIWDNAEQLLTKIGVDQSTLLDQVTNMLDTSKIVAVAQEALGQLTSFGSLLMVMALTIVFLMFDLSRIELRATALAKIKPGMFSALKEFTYSVRSYWLVSTLFGLIVAVLDVIALEILNVPMAATWGVLAFITNYIPNVGFFLGLIPPALLALLDSGPWTALWVAVAYIVLNFVIQSLIQPKFTGDAVGLNTTTAFLSLLLWSQIIGSLGAILAIPLTIFVKAILIDSDPRARWVGIFLSAGDAPILDPDRVEEEVLEEMEELPAQNASSVQVAESNSTKPSC